MENAVRFGMRKIQECCEYYIAHDTTGRYCKVMQHIPPGEVGRILKRQGAIVWRTGLCCSGSLHCWQPLPVWVPWCCMWPEDNLMLDAHIAYYAGIYHNPSRVGVVQ